MDLVIGYGNPTRQDDGVGQYLAVLLQQRFKESFELMLLQQLNLELVLDMLDFNKILLIDASVNEPEIQFRRVDHEVEKNLIASSHGLGPEVLVGLAKSLYQKNIEMYLLTIKGERFDIGEGISDIVKARCYEAMEWIPKKMHWSN